MVRSLLCCLSPPVLTITSQLPAIPLSAPHCISAHVAFPTFIFSSTSPCTHASTRLIRTVLTAHVASLLYLPFQLSPGAIALSLSLPTCLVPASVSGTSASLQLQIRPSRSRPVVLFIPFVFLATPRSSAYATVHDIQCTCICTVALFPMYE